MNYLLALLVNLWGMLVIYSLMAFALARLRWRRRGLIAVLLTIIAAGQFWIAPALIVRHSTAAGLASYSFSYCNWLISGFSIIVLCQAVRWIPRQLEDASRLDGCGWFGTYWHVLLPFVKRELSLIVFLTVLGTSMLLAGLLALRNESGVSLALSLDLLIGASLVASLSVIVVFLFVKGPLLKGSEPAG